MSDVDILQTDRGMGKTTAVIERTLELIDGGAESTPVLVIVPSEMQVRLLVDQFRYLGVKCPSPLVQVVSEKYSDMRLRGHPRGARIIAEDVDSWPDGIYSKALCGPIPVDLITSSFNPEPTLRMIRRVTRHQREMEARRQAAYRRAQKRAADAAMVAHMKAYIAMSERYPASTVEADGTT